MRRAIRSEGAPNPIGPYSQGVEAAADGIAPAVNVYCSGQIGADPSTGNLADGIVAQTARCLKNVGNVLASANLSLKDVVKTTVFMVDLSQFPQMNEEYAKAFSAPFPARSTVQVSALPKGALVEIDAVAVKV